MSAENSSSALLLLVEDDDEIRETLAMLLQTRGFDVIEARHGRHAIDRIHARGVRPALIVLDMQMPVMDGEGFLEAQVAEPLLAHVPVVVLTAQLRLPDPLPPHVRAVITKPVQLSLLVQVIRTEMDERARLPLTMLAKGTGAIHETVIAVADEELPNEQPVDPPPPPSDRADSEIS